MNANTVYENLIKVTPIELNNAVVRDEFGDLVYGDTAATKLEFKKKIYFI